MASLKSRDGYEFDGTAALKHQAAPVLRVYEGYAPSFDPAGARQRARYALRRSARPTEAAALTHSESLKAALVIVGIVCALLLTSFVADGLHTSSVSARISSMPVEEVHVYSGQTIWGIAEEHPVDGVSTKELVSWIENSNDLSSDAVVPGQTLRIPVVGK